MLPTRAATRKRSSRDPFRQAPWGEGHPELLRIDSQLAADHHARWLKDAVGRLDLSPLRQAYANRGSLAHPPQRLLPFVLFLYALGQTSPARWAAAARESDPCKWLLGGLRPCRSALYDFRDRVEPFLKSWNKQLIDWAVAEGVTSARRGSLDGSFVASLASRHRLLSCRAVDARLLLLLLAVCVDEHPAGEVEGLVAWLLTAEASLVEPPLPVLGAVLLALLLLHRQPEAVRRGVLPAWLPGTPAGRGRLLRRLHKAHKRQQQRLEPLAGKQRLSKRDRQALRAKVSPSDPEAALGFDKAGTYRPLYNLQLVQAGDANLTLAWELFARNNDDGLLRPMMEQTQEQLGRHLGEVIVDGAFVSVGDIAYCEEHAITVYAPPARQGQAKGGAAGEADAGAGASAAGRPKAAGPGRVQKYGKEEFRYDPARKEYRCPQGKALPEAFRTSEKRPGGVELPVLVHRAAAADCRACPQRQRCTTGARGRVVKRYEGEEALERLAERMAEPANQEVYRLRGRTVEPGYGELKEQRGLRVLRCFGIKRSRAQAGLTILANNALSIARALRRRDSDAKPPPSDDSQVA